MNFRLRHTFVFIATLLAPSLALAAGPDGVVEWSGISHYSWQDRRPLCPLGGETFQVRFQAWRNDLTAARVRVDTGAIAFANAAVVGQRGPYDIWAAQVPASVPGGSLSYVIELTDGADVDWFGPGGLEDNLPAGGLVVDFATLSHAPYGATPSTGGVVFRTWSPGRTSAHVRGTFNAEAATNPMTALGEDFIAFVPGAQIGDQYRYSFDNGVWNADPRGRSLTSAATQKAIVFDPLSYAWTSGPFTTPPIEELVIYQLHVGTFAGRNDPYGAAPNPSRFIDVANRVDHLAELGVNAIQVCPFTAFPSDFSAGYNPISLWAPEAKYGLPDQLKFMVDRCHQKGIAVLLDLVWNHFSATDNYLWHWNGDQIFYDTPNVNTPWGPQLDFDRAQVADYIAHSSHYWLEEYRLDGYRMDGTDYMNMVGGQETSGWALMQRFNNEIDNRWADKVTIAEQLPNDTWVTRPTSLGGAGFDAQYHDAFNDNLRQELFDAAFGDPEMWKISNIVNGSGPGLSNRAALNYLELHDEAWPASGGQRMVRTIDPSAPHDDEWARGRTKLGQGMVLFSPGVPEILQGTEWLEDTDFGANADGSSRIDWSKRTTYATTYRYYQDAIRFRRNYGCFRADAGHQVFHVNEGGNVIAFQRWDMSGNVFVVVGNFSNVDYPVYRLGLPQPGTWTEVLNSQSSVYSGSGLDNPVPFASQAMPYDGFAQSAEIRIPKMGFILLKWGTNLVDAGDGAPGVPAGGALSFRAVTPNPVSAGTQARFEFTLARPGRVTATVHDAAGRQVATVGARDFAAGPQAIAWDGAHETGGRAPAGVYFARIEFEGKAAVRKFVRI